ncbi:MerR family DNA-binding transcriptional regulator [Streptomyces piniterrae]|uniref:MerR family DNA-binding transcriptional regulator n=1 Tax=Streptomyces piniterrae TaxID=2571125 RepID=A0A4U0NVS0_9ACTN|nr:MerR family DNA-binding transcriptional regulator [Streptomyces piniterrae]TJZ58821.1 MerR family DNA-binding transcriptional regulator [Streptomyces piniterrae]
MRPTDLAREHGISTQAVRNYERDGFIPPAERTRSGYRIYTEVHAAALRTYVALLPAYGHSAGGQIMTAVHDDELDDALTVIDRGHSQLLRDRDTLDAVRKAVGHLTAESVAVPDPSADPAARTIGELAHQLRVTPATLRNWEDVGILTPSRDPVTGYRVFRAGDIRDAELAHLLRRGGYPLDHISTVVQQIRTAGGTDALSGSLDDWQRKLTARGLAMLDAAARLSHYLSVLSRAAPREFTVAPPSR